MLLNSWSLNFGGETAAWRERYDQGSVSRFCCCEQSFGSDMEIVCPCGIKGWCMYFPAYRCNSVVHNGID